MTDRVTSPMSGGGSSYASSSESSSGSGSTSSQSCEISLLERLIRTHPIWFLPSLQRSGALHLLQGRDVGNFIVRSSTQPSTMALTVKLPDVVEHYLLKAVNNRIALENSSNTFDTVHQLIAHYCVLSSEIPVCLKIPQAIADATTRQQLRSLALLGQEFWTHPYSANIKKELSSPSDLELDKNSNPELNIGSHSSSQNSLSDPKKPLRPTTLELTSSCVPGGIGNGLIPPPPVPPRWSRSTLLTPLSLPSSVQSTPSEVQSLFSERCERVGGKKKRRPNSGKPQSTIHYKDTEILDLFKGTKTSYDDKASDYEDIWSPQNKISQGPRFSTFKPDLIASSFDVDLQRNDYEFQSISHLLRNRNEQINRVQLRNSKNSQLGFSHALSVSELQNVNLNKQVELNSKHNLGNSKENSYSEPVDSIAFRRFGNYRNSEPNIRWSCGPAMMSLVNVEEHLNEQGEEINRNTMDISSYSPGSQTNGSFRNFDSSMGNTNGTTHDFGNDKQRGQEVTCASVDNLCHLGDFGRRAKNRLLCGGVPENDKRNPPQPLKPTLRPRNVLTPSEPQPRILNPGKPQPAPRKTLNKKFMDKDGLGEHGILETSNNQSWHLDNSWEFVMWDREDNNPEASASKFPITSPNNNTSRFDLSQNNNKFLSQRLSRYDNLEKECDDQETHSSNESPEGEKEEKISSPWDSSKWENLLRIVSESTQQLDSLEFSEGREVTNKNIFNERVGVHKLEGNRESKSIMDSNQRVSKILEVSRSVDKASKEISNVVRNLALKGDGFFGPTLKSFISCTIGARIQDPYKVMRNVRQFISGLKNYLTGVSPESSELREAIKKSTEQLNDTEFLNIDSILEEVMVDLVISPLNSHVRDLLQAHYSKGDHTLRYSDINQGSLPFEFSPNNTQKVLDMEKLRKIILGFEESVSPITKLDKWNEFICQVQEMDNYNGESFLPLLAQMLGAVCSSNLCTDVDYMIGLLPHSLAESNNYSLSLLQSAVSALKAKKERKGTLTSIRVIIPDERNGTLIRKMVPIRETTTTEQVAKLVATKVGIVNPGDYALVRIKNGEEKLCCNGELVSQLLEDNQTALAYKRLDAKIGWPMKMT